MIVFMIVLLICMFAFGDAFMAIDRAQDLDILAELEVQEDTVGGASTALLRYLKGSKGGVGGGSVDSTGSEGSLQLLQGSTWDRYLHALQTSLTICLGDFTLLDIKGLRGIDWILFILCTFLLLILMLNLLIAIISDTYTKISHNGNEISYKEKAIVVAGMQDTLKYCLKAKIDHNERLFVAKVIESEDLMKQDFENKIDCLREEIREMNQKMGEIT